LWVHYGLVHDNSKAVPILLKLLQKKKAHKINQVHALLQQTSCRTLTTQLSPCERFEEMVFSTFLARYSQISNCSNFLEIILCSQLHTQNCMYPPEAQEKKIQVKLTQNVDCWKAEQLHTLTPDSSTKGTKKFLNPD
jgi:hypothetical protein